MGVFNILLWIASITQVVFYFAFPLHRDKLDVKYHIHIFFFRHTHKYCIYIISLCFCTSHIYFIIIIGIIIFEYLLSSIVNILNIKALNPNLPKEFEGVFDQDKYAHKNALPEDAFKLINANFRHLKNFLRMEGVRKIDGLLADLGVSSHQFDVAERGFSIRFDGELDMRMNTNSSLSAKQVVNEYGQEELANVLFKYGELRNSRAIAREIINARDIETIVTTNQLIEVVEKMVPEKKRNQFLARIFQAIRIEVNDEIKALEEMLLDAVDMLNEGGRLVVLSYHSLEDRMVKNLMKKGNI
jgi:16S rRNA (cytosine1402-N4)-methyltransferase